MFGNSHFKSYQQDGFTFLKISTENRNNNTLVFLHGLFGGLSNYDALIKELDEYNIYVPAIPIHDFDEELSIKNLTIWLHDFLKTLEINKPTLLGNSLGGHLALNYVLQHPENVSSLVLTGSSGLQEKDFGSTFPRRNDREYVRKQAALTFYDDIIDDVLLDNIMDVISSPSKLRNILAITRDTHEFNMEQYLPEITHEVLLIWGRNDEITPPEVGREFNQKLPNSRLRWIDKCGHAPMMEHPKAFALFLNEFLLELDNNRNDKTIDGYEENYSHL